MDRNSHCLLTHAALPQPAIILLDTIGSKQATAAAAAAACSTQAEPIPAPTYVHVQAVLVCGGVDGHCLQAHLAAGADDAHCNLAAVGNQHLLNLALLRNHRRRRRRRGATAGAASHRGRQLLPQRGAGHKLAALSRHKVAAQGYGRCRCRPRGRRRPLRRRAPPSYRSRRGLQGTDPRRPTITRAMPRHLRQPGGSGGQCRPCSAPAHGPALALTPWWTGIPGSELQMHVRVAAIGQQHRPPSCDLVQPGVGVPWLALDCSPVRAIYAQSCALTAEHRRGSMASC